MNKKVLIGIILIFIGALFVIFEIVSNDGSKTIEFTYNTNGGVPYIWKYEIEDDSIVEFVKSYEISNENKNGMVGAPVSTNYVFRGLKKGKTTITFKYVHVDGQSIEKKEKIVVKVDSNKNISLVTVE